MGLACTARSEVELLPLKPKALLYSYSCGGVSPTSCQVPPACVYSPFEAHVILRTARSRYSLLLLQLVEILPISKVSKVSFVIRHEKEEELGKDSDSIGIIVDTYVICCLLVELLQISGYRRYLVYQLSCSVRLELLAKLSTRYKTIQSVTNRYIGYCSP